MATRAWRKAAVVVGVLLLMVARPSIPPAAAQQFSAWSAPVNLGEVVNSSVTEQTPVISRDGLSLYFASDRPGGFGGSDIWVSQRDTTSGPWGDPQNLGSNVNTAFGDISPALSADGHRLFFHSSRPGGLGAFDIYASRRRDKRDDFGWGPAQNLGSTVNTLGREAGPEYFEDPVTGVRTLFFNSDRPGGSGGNDIYASTMQADGTFSTPVQVAELNSVADDQALAVRRDGLELILASNRLGTLGGLDLWVATRAKTSEPWEKPVHLGDVLNTTAAEAGVALSFDGTALYFHSGRPGGFGAFDLYVSTRSKVRTPDDDPASRPR